jgi:FlaA1/EpsC-like NDP-sugar epimerase
MANKLAPGRVIALEFTALRPGDKETELLWSPDDLAQPMSLDPSISALPPTIVSIQSSSLTGPQLDTGLAALRTALDARDVAAALTGLQLLVPDFTPSHAVLSLAREGSTQVSR